MQSRINHIIKFTCCCIIVIAFGCKEKYDAPFIAPSLGYLVVEGFINFDGPTNIKLTRTLQLGASRLNGELGALVRIEGQDNSTYPLTEKGQGLYTADKLPLNTNTKYRLYIRTFNSREYISEFSQVITTPPIDKIEWERPGGVQLYLSSHDPRNQAHYYRWEYDETWKFNSAYRSVIKYKRNSLGTILGVEFRTTEESDKLYTCWRSESANKILLGSTLQLNSDSINRMPVTFIENNSVRISIMYSINVRQIAISEAEYNFYQVMKKNTEQLGSLFDPQPSQVKGNIQCRNNPQEIVIGYVSVSNPQEKRIFISNDEVPGWRYVPDCPETKVENKPDKLALYSNLIPTLVNDYDDVTGEITFINVAGPACVDCTTLGTNIKPPFWP